LSNLNVKPPLHEREAPTHKRKAPLLTTFGQRFWVGLPETKTQQGRKFDETCRVLLCLCEDSKK